MNAKPQKGVTFSKRSMFCQKLKYIHQKSCWSRLYDKI